MKNLFSWLLVAVVCVQCVEWTRLTGKVKGINLKESAVTIQMKDGDLLVVPIDYQVKIVNKHDELRGLKQLELDEKVTLIRVPADKPVEDTEGLVPPDPKLRGF